MTRYRHTSSVASNSIID